jgi:centrosomal CEP192-like protein/ASPM-SPD-2-Hydin domain-containing protein
MPPTQFRSSGSIRSATSLNLQSSPASTAVWQPLGPSAVMTPNYGLVTGRVSSIAIDPADVTGNHVYLGTTGGGVWVSQNAASSGKVVFSPLTDPSSPFEILRYGSNSIGALTVQPGGTGVVLAGTGDPNDALDSYYGAGVLRSTDGGSTWTAIPFTTDLLYSFMGEGFAGFAWSTVNPQLVVAAVSQSYEGTLVSAPYQNKSYAGLYYSTDAGATWSLARITDGAGKDVQGPLSAFASPHGNSATAVVWNPVRRLFISAVRFHGYYQSTDGITWSRMAAQPGTSLTSQMCPNNLGSIGSIACPIFRGALAVNPVSGDTFAWTVDLYNQDQGLWQDACAVSSGTCSSEAVTFAQRRNTAPLQTNTILGTATVPNGDYNLALAAIPSAQDTILLAGANDLWRCTLAMGCSWRNATNAYTCMSAHVAPYQHALTWNPANPFEVLIGNDSGLWRSMDAAAESGSACSSDDAFHFQNLNAGLGSLAEVESISEGRDTPYTMIAGLGVNGTAGVKSTSGPTSTWPQILGGEGGNVAIDPATPTKWYVNSGAGVSIHRCSQSTDCTPDAFGSQAVVNNTDVAGDGYTMTSPAPFIIDPLDPSQILLGTCRMWRGPADGTRWAPANAISPFLDGLSNHTYCSGDALIRSIAALPTTGGREVIFVGMFGSLNSGATLGGHILQAVFMPGSSSQPEWRDLTLSPVANSQVSFNHYALDISSIFIDPHDPSGNTVYVTVAGVPDFYHAICTVYRTTDGGSHWYEINSNVRTSPANSIVIDPQDANTAYLATDAGVYSTRQVSTCINGPSNCWSVFGAGLPYAPVTQLTAAVGPPSPAVLVAATYGRGIWQIPLWTAGTELTTASIESSSLTFAAQTVGTASPAQTITLTNDGGIALAITSIVADPPFSENDNCLGNALNEGAACTIQVVFAPDHVGAATGELTLFGNVPDGRINVALAGTGSLSGPIKVSPGILDFGQVAIGSTSASMSVTLENTTSSALAFTSVSASGPFSIAGNPCGQALPANSACAISVVFAPSLAGPVTGTLTVVDGAGTQTIYLKGTGATAPSDTLSSRSLAFSSTAVGQESTPQVVTLSNTGDLPLNAITAIASAGFRSSDTCQGSLGAHAICSISVVFAPVNVGPVSGTLTVKDAVRSQTVDLVGTALAAPAFKVSSSQVAFNPVLVGQRSPAVPLTITNSGGAPMSNVAFQISGPGAASFSWSQNTCSVTLPSGSGCTVQLTFAPVQAGQLSATLVLSSSTLGVSPAQVDLSGMGQGASDIRISPSQLTFQQSKLGMTTAPQFATVTNTSEVTASELTVAASTSFTLTQNSCGSSLVPAGTCSVGVVFSPIANGRVSGTLSVSARDFAGPAIASLVGLGGAVGSVQTQPGAITFPTTGVGTTSQPQLLTLTNSGPVEISDLAITVSAGFRISSSTCGAVLNVSTSCTAQIAFTPLSAGTQSGIVTVSSSSLPTPAQIAASGMGFDFSIGAGQSSKTVSSGQTAIYAFTLSPLNGSAGTFTYSCSSLPVNSSCNFSPTSTYVPANADWSVTLNISTGATHSTANVTASRFRSYLFPATCLVFIPIVLKFRRRKVWIVILTSSLFGIVSCAGAGGGGGGKPPATNQNTPPGTYSVVVTANASGVSHNITLTLIVD